MIFIADALNRYMIFRVYGRMSFMAFDTGGYVFPAVPAL